jgi:hypothetical protein
MFYMKYTLAFLAAVMVVFSASSQKTQKFAAAKNNDFGLTYSLPVTHMRITVEAEKTVKKAGPYYKYAKKYLGTSDVITDDSQSWELTSVKVSSFGVPDDAQQYLMQFKSGSSPFIMKTDDGILLSINAENVQEQQVDKRIATQQETVLDNNNYLSALPGDLLASGSTAKRAEIAAQQIYKLRQSRSDYATGEADHMPDGEALKLIMKQLDSQEAALTALFVGTTQKSTAVRTFDYVPGTEDVKDAVVFRISDFDGIVDKGDLSGEPVYLTMKVVEQGKMPVNEKGEEKKVPKDAVIYKIPGKAQFTLRYEGKQVFDKTFDLAQLGIAYGLDPDMFDSKKQPAYVKFAPQTGSVVEIGNVTATANE